MSGNNYEYSEWELREDNHRRMREQVRGKNGIVSFNQARRLSHFCKKGAMHSCSACSNGDRQKSCHFHIPSSGGNRCMDLRFDEFCANQILHQYISGGISDGRADSLVSTKKNTVAKINNDLAGYHVDFPLDGEETPKNVEAIYHQLSDLGMGKPEFWVDRNGNPMDELFTITIEDIRNGIWLPKRKELLKDILKYLDLKEKVGL